MICEKMIASLSEKWDFCLRIEMQPYDKAFVT